MHSKYEKCKEFFESSTENDAEDLWVSFDRKCLLKSCGYYRKDCADDCSTHADVK